MIDLPVRLGMRDFKKWGGILIMGVREGGRWFWNGGGWYPFTDYDITANEFGFFTLAYNLWDNIQICREKTVNKCLVTIYICINFEDTHLIISCFNVTTVCDLQAKSWIHANVLDPNLSRISKNKAIKDPCCNCLSL